MQKEKIFFAVAILSLAIIGGISYALSVAPPIATTAIIPIPSNATTGGGTTYISTPYVFTPPLFSGSATWQPTANYLWLLLLLLIAVLAIVLVAYYSKRQKAKP